MHDATRDDPDVGMLAGTPLEVSSTERGATLLHDTRRASVTVDDVAVSVYTVPTSAAESDGTFEWDRTTLVVVEVSGGGRRGLGYTYADTATARLINDMLAERVRGLDALSPPAAWDAMVHATRNLGRPGIVSMAIAAVDTALWDLKARLHDCPLVVL